jgi:uncharacterized glyoxalase superfamily protein PhnB
MNNRSVPTATVLPHVVYRNVSDACDWLCRVLGFSEHYRYGEPLSGIQIYLGNAYIMLQGPGSRRETPAVLGSATQMLTIFVNNVDAHYKRATQAGAKIWEELHETVYGERQYGVEDPDGHRWLFAQHARDVDPKVWGAKVLSPPGKL